MKREVHKGMKTAPLFTLLFVFLAACGASKGRSGGVDEARARRGPLGRIDEGARCDRKLGRELLVDLNQDGRPDVRKVFKSVGEDEVQVCREADLNFDGTKDVFVYFEDTGRILRDEVDLDFDQRIDIVSYWSNGKVVKQEIDTNSDGLVDRVRYLQNDQPIRLEGDTDGDGRVDLWEYYVSGRLVRVGTDENGDGKADKWFRDNFTEESHEAAVEEGDEAQAGDGAEGEKAKKAPEPPVRDEMLRVSEDEAPEDAGKGESKGSGTSGKR